MEPSKPTKPTHRSNQSIASRLQKYLELLLNEAEQMPANQQEAISAILLFLFIIAWTYVGPPNSPR